MSNNIPHCGSPRLPHCVAALHVAGNVGSEESMLQGSGAACMCGAGYTQQRRPMWRVSTCFFVKLWVSQSSLVLDE